MRIAHFSDPHVLSMDGVRARDFMNKRWLGGVNLVVNRSREHSVAVFEAMVDDINNQGVDHVLCTGDVSNVAVEPEFALARRCFDRFCHGTSDVTVIPGNHDAYIAAGLPLFARHFGEFHECDPEWAWPDGVEWPVVRIRGDVALICVSTAQTTPWLTAWGDVGKRQLDRIERVLLDPRLASLFRLVAIHHPPAGHAAAHWRHGLRDRRRFAAAIVRAGAELVLHGHEHRDLAATLAGAGGTVVPVRGIQSATFAGDRPGLLASYRIYTIGRSGNGRPQVAHEDLRTWSNGSRSYESVRK